MGTRKASAAFCKQDGAQGRLGMALYSTSYPSGATISVAMAVLCGVFASSPSHGQPSMTNSGTLTCTVADVPSKPSAVVELSCNFKSQSGVTSDYAGSAGTKTEGIPPAKHVFIWTVVAIDTAKDPLLDGTFAAEKGRQGPAVLVGGGDGSTRLEPVTGNDQLAGPSEITTLTLKLAATKT
jgi:hypothetical protein